MTRARAQLQQDEVNLVLNEYEHASTKNCLLTNGSAFLVLRFQEEAKKICPSDREQVAVPVMAPDSVTEVQGKNYFSPEGFTMSILYRWKHLEVYFHMEQMEHLLRLFT